jgi:hypothetical protein
LTMSAVALPRSSILVRAIFMPTLVKNYLGIFQPGVYDPETAQILFIKLLKNYAPNGAHSSLQRTRSGTNFAASST